MATKIQNENIQPDGNQITISDDFKFNKNDVI